MMSEIILPQLLEIFASKGAAGWLSRLSDPPFGFSIGCGIEPCVGLCTQWGICLRFFPLLVCVRALSPSFSLKYVNEIFVKLIRNGSQILFSIKGVSYFHQEWQLFNTYLNQWYLK